MARKASLYAAVLLKALKGVSVKEQRARIARFKQQLLKRGDLRHFSSILLEFEKLWEQKEGVIAQLVSAEKPSLLFIESMKKVLQKQGYQTKTQENNLLIGGSAVFLGNEYMIDNSVKGKLKKIAQLLNG